jgi:hypothetical protein
MRLAPRIVAVSLCAGLLASPLPTACSPNKYEEWVDLDPLAIVLKGGETQEFDLQVQVQVGRNSNVEVVEVDVGIGVPPLAVDDSGVDDTAAEQEAEVTLAGLYLRVADDQGNLSEDDLDGTADGFRSAFTICDGTYDCRESYGAPCDLEGGDTCVMNYAIALSNRTDVVIDLDVLASAVMNSVKDPPRDTSMTLTID